MIDRRSIGHGTPWQMGSSDHFITRQPTTAQLFYFPHPCLRNRHRQGFFVLTRTTHRKILPIFRGVDDHSSTFLAPTWENWRKIGSSGRSASVAGLRLNDHANFRHGSTIVTVAAEQERRKICGRRFYAANERSPLSQRRTLLWPGMSATSKMRSERLHSITAPVNHCRGNYAQDIT